MYWRIHSIITKQNKTKNYSMRDDYYVLICLAVCYYVANLRTRTTTIVNTIRTATPARRNLLVIALLNIVLITRFAEPMFSFICSICEVCVNIRKSAIANAKCFYPIALPLYSVSLNNKLNLSCFCYLKILIHSLVCSLQMVQCLGSQLEYVLVKNVCQIYGITIIARSVAVNKRVLWSVDETDMSEDAPENNFSRSDP